LFAKSLNVVKKEDDFSEMIFKLFEQVRLLNDDLINHNEMQQSKKSSIMKLQSILLTEDDYKYFLSQLKA
jgi:predicted Ser/Thr protein kinase